jgi:serine/threonine-protein kinase
MLLLDDVLGALAAAHAAGLIHRDLKPSNLFLVSQPDGTKFVKVLDFGLARPMGKRDAQTQELLLGTPEYMAPELIHGGELGAWTDLYALGVIAWQMLAGKRMFGDGSVTAILRKHLDAPVPPLSLHAKGVPPPLEKWVSSLLHKDWRKRPRDTFEVRQKLKRMLHALSTEKTLPAEGLTVTSKDAPTVTAKATDEVAVPLGAPLGDLRATATEANTDPDNAAIVDGPIPDVPAHATRESAVITDPELTAREEGRGFLGWLVALTRRLLGRPRA